MKLIDFDELEKLKDREDEESVEDNWDGGFFAEFADEISEDSEDEDEAYLAMPSELQKLSPSGHAQQEEEYMRIPQELKEEYQEKLKQQEAEEEEPVVVSADETDEKEEGPEAEPLPLEEKRMQLGRMLGLRVPEEVVEPQKIEELPEFDFEAMADRMAEELLEQQKVEQEAAVKEAEESKEQKQEQEETEPKEPVSYDPLAYGTENSQEYQEFRDAYVRKHILKEESPKEELPNPDMEELPEPEESVREEFLAEEPLTEETIEESEKFTEEAEELPVAEESEVFVAEDDYEEDEESAFLDDEELLRIEQEEERRISAEEVPEESMEESEEFVEEEVLEEPEESIEEPEEFVEELPEASEKAVKDLTEEPEESTETAEEAEEKQVMHIRNLPPVENMKKTVPEGVLTKRTLPNRKLQEKQTACTTEQETVSKIETAPRKDAASGNVASDSVEKKNEASDTGAAARASLGLSGGRKIRKLQSAFEDEYLDMLDTDIFARKNEKRKKNNKHHRKSFKENKEIWEDEDKTPDNPFREFISLLIAIAAVVLVTFVLVEFVGQRTEVNGESMESTLHNGDNLIVDKITYAFRDPQRFDIVVFPYKMVNSDKEVYYIKRIIGLPGERVQIANGFIYINGELLVESYGKNNNLILNPGRAEREIQLGEDEYFVLGDNRNNSSDSREIGNIKRDIIVGRAWLRIWPLSDFGILKHQ